MQYGTLESACRSGGGKGVKMEGANWMDIRSDRQRGFSYTEIARKYNIDPTERGEAVKAGPVQGADRNMAGGSTVLGGMNSGKDPGAGLRRRAQHCAGVCTQQKGTTGREGNGAV